jgi:hypothetical protein
MPSFSQTTLLLASAPVLFAEAGTVAPVSLTKANFDELVKQSGKSSLVLYNIGQSIRKIVPGNTILVKQSGKIKSSLVIQYWSNKAENPIVPGNTISVKQS